MIIGHYINTNGILVYESYNMISSIEGVQTDHGELFFLIKLI